MKEVTIIVPCYNVESYVAECIESLVNQTLDNSKYEIIIVNDGSTDGTQNIIDTYQKKYPNIIRAYKKKNGGLGSARNFGISKATKSRYISFIDSDDYCELDMFENLLKAGKRDKAEIVIGSFKRFYERRVCLYEKMFMPNKKFKRFVGKLEGEMLAKLFPSVWNKLYSWKLIENFKFPKGKFEDTPTIELFIKSKRVTIIPEYVYNYRIRENSLVSNVEFGDFLIVKNYEGIFNGFKMRSDFFKIHEEIEYSFIKFAYIMLTARYFMFYHEYDQEEIIDKIISLCVELSPNPLSNIYLKKNFFEHIYMRLLIKRRYRIIKFIFYRIGAIKL